MKFRVGIGLFAGDFASQQLAFAHLYDIAPDADLEQVEVLSRPFAKRLAHYFDPADLATMPAPAENTMILAFPGAGLPLAPTDRLRLLGRFPGTITRALLPEA